MGGSTDPLFDVVFSEYRPNQVVAYTPVQEQDLPIPLLGDRPQMGRKATAYVCWSAGFFRQTTAWRKTALYIFACQMPVTDAEGLMTRIDD